MSVTTSASSIGDEAIANAKHLVDGELVAGTGVIEVFDPSTGEVFAHCPTADDTIVDQAMGAAARALPEWARSADARRAALAKMTDVIAANADLLAYVLARDTGNPNAAMEVQGAVDHARYWSELQIPVDTVDFGPGGKVTVERHPAGVVAMILAWNAPLLMLVNKIGCALLAGDTIVAKPSPFAPLTPLVFGALISDVFPAGVMNIVVGDADTGKAMVSHRLTNLVSFTGSVAAGRSIAGVASTELKRLALELGGNDAAIVLPEVDLDAAIPGIWNGAFFHSGQICSAVKRLYVHQSRYQEVSERLAAIAEQQHLGSPFEPGVTMGPLTTRPQFERVSELVADALRSGGEAIAGGAPVDREGYFIEPTIFRGLTAGSRLVDEEQFGPVLPVLSYSDLEDAIFAANDTSYGLSGSVWGADLEFAQSVARRLQAGTVWVNRHGAMSAATPYGGFKDSGIGRENGLLGVDHFSELQTVHVGL